MLDASAKLARVDETVGAIQKEISRLTDAIAKLADVDKMLGEVHGRLTTQSQRMEREADQTRRLADRVDRLEEHLAEARGALKMLRIALSAGMLLLVPAVGFVWTEVGRLGEVAVRAEGKYAEIVREIQIIRDDDAAHKLSDAERSNRIEKALEGRRK
jgi:uncharacterized coiled-coil protein SlyX